MAKCRQLVDLLSNTETWKIFTTYYQEYGKEDFIQLCYVASGLTYHPNIRARNPFQICMREGVNSQTSTMYKYMPCAIKVINDEGMVSWRHPVGDNITHIVFSDGKLNLTVAKFFEHFKINEDNYRWVADYCTSLVCGWAMGGMTYNCRMKTGDVGGAFASIRGPTAFLARTEGLPKWVTMSPTSPFCPPFARVISCARIAKNPDKLAEMIGIADRIGELYGRMVANKEFRDGGMDFKLSELNKYSCMEGVFPEFTQDPFHFPGESFSDLYGEYEPKMAYRILGVLGECGVPTNLLDYVTEDLRRAICYKNLPGGTVKITGHLEGTESRGLVMKGMMVGSANYGIANTSQQNADALYMSYTGRNVQTGIPEVKVITEKGEKTVSGITNGIYLGSIFPGEYNATEARKQAGEREATRKRALDEIDAKVVHYVNIGEKKHNVLYIARIIREKFLVGKLEQYLTDMHISSDTIIEEFFTQSKDARGRLVRQCLGDDYGKILQELRKFK